MSPNEQEVPSPCVRNCCLDPEDICLGCFRHLDEITGWMAMSTSQKKVVLKRTEERRKKYPPTLYK
ncbi:MAG: DUF1289 domain-containing protein [Kangiellaceae bacterium]|nr:DUF1289 domain-containing protein [Kangiellaceae bacterium]